MLSVWEIRHGSVMALREILTHHGASAGVYLPDLNSDDALYHEIKDIDYSSKLKREREIDLNMQVSPDESESNLKRPKLEDGSFPVMDKMIPAGQHGGFDVAVKIENAAWTVPSGQFNGQHNIIPMKIETEFYHDDMMFQSKEAVEAEEPKSYYEDKGAFANSDVLKNLPENCELINLVKLARHSWLKNCEFLQDCAIRFLCVLSLDRYALFPHGCYLYCETF